MNHTYNEELEQIITEIDQQLKVRKRWIIALAFVGSIFLCVAVLEFFVIQDMAYDLRNEISINRDLISINHDLEQIASFCMQSNFTNTGDSQ